DNIKNLFGNKEWNEILNTNKKRAPGIDENLAKHLLNYKKNTPSEMREQVMKPWFQTMYNQEQHYDYQYIHQVFTHMLDEYESPKNRLTQQHSEGWYATNIWSMLIDKAFLNVLNIELVCEDTCSIASSNRKNDNELYKIKGQRKAIGRRIDGIFKNTVNGYEYGGIEVSKICQGPHERKNLDIVKKMEIVGLLHSRLQLQQLLMDYGGGSCLRLKKEDTISVPLHLGDVMELITMISNILRAKLRISHCIKLLKKTEPE
ncbi:30182_t:CDS:2, partial [Racocetra persica]